ncbi:MAG: hypothetical protein K6A63_00675 [Acholeplasmatales bacterium]|nr:hypothetical protein [Acholeplasmatales bacterium]
MASWNNSNADVVKNLTICHDIVYDDISLFPNLTNLTFDNVASCFLTYEESELIIPDYIGRDDGLDIDVSLIASNKYYDATNFKVTTIYIPEYVTTIESGAFSMLIGVTLKTEYTEKPAGWADDFNSNLEVEWGVEINTETDK